MNEEENAAPEAAKEVDAAGKLLKGLMGQSVLDPRYIAESPTSWCDLLRNWRTEKTLAGYVELLNKVPGAGPQVKNKTDMGQRLLFQKAQFLLRVAQKSVRLAAGSLSKKQNLIQEIGCVALKVLLKSETLNFIKKFHKILELPAELRPVILTEIITLGKLLCPKGGTPVTWDEMIVPQRTQEKLLVSLEAFCQRALIENVFWGNDKAKNREAGVSLEDVIEDLVDILCCLGSFGFLKEEILSTDDEGARGTKLQFLKEYALAEGVVLSKRSVGIRSETLSTITQQAAQATGSPTALKIVEIESALQIKN